MTMRGYYPLGRNTASLYAEYRDEVGKYNKKQEVLLQRHLRVIRRQERHTEGVIKKCRQEVTQMKKDIHNTETHSMDLSDYDTVKEFQKIVGKTCFKRDLDFSSFGSHSVAASPQITPRPGGPRVKLPPIWQRNGQDARNSSQKQQQGGISSRYLGAGQPKALSMRDLKSKKRLLEPIETTRNSHRSHQSLHPPETQTTRVDNDCEGEENRGSEGKEGIQEDLNMVAKG